jgi:aminoglycoside phosphotransferase (APT) family kinase protein
MAHDWPIVQLTPERCARALRAAGIVEPLTGCAPLPMPDYSPNAVAILNDRYVLRATAFDGTARFTRECDALAQLRELSGVPRVLAAGTLDPDEQIQYMLEDRIPGRAVFPLWLELADAARARVVAGLAAIIRPVHRIELPAYAIGYYGWALRDWRGTWLDGHDAHMHDLLSRIRARALTTAQLKLVREAEGYYVAHRRTLAHAGGPRFAHGDLHLYNVLAEGHRVTGIIDWEWAYGGGTEPDFDLATLVRWAIYPRANAEEALEDRVSGEDFAPLIPALLATYPEIAAIPQLRERMTIYQIEHELGQMATWPGRVPQLPVARLRGWLREDPLATLLP